MIAGVLLGPSLFGALLPGWHAAVFPKATLDVLHVAAQLGCGLYMFLVGIEFRGDLFRARLPAAFGVSVAGMLTPFLLGAILAPWLVATGGLFAPAATVPEATLFLGAAIAITAFPMLARIVHERGLTGTPLGTLALAAGAIDDAAAWCVLAIVLASFQRLPDGSVDGASIALACGGGLAYAVLMPTLGRRLLAPLGRAAERAGAVSPALLGVVLAVFCLCAFAMDVCGVHAVFGGFLLGVAMPRGLLTREVRQQLEPFTVVFLLPIFFTWSGLNTRLDLLAGGGIAMVAVAVLAASVAGKGVACWAAARLAGQDNRTALAVGTLMNSRGLMELIIVGIGLRRGIILEPLFAMLVLMAIVTTLMASPLFELVYGARARRDGTLPPAG